MDPSPVAQAPPPGVPVPSLVLSGGELVDTGSLREVRRAPARDRGSSNGRGGRHLSTEDRHSTPPATGSSLNLRRDAMGFGRVNRRGPPMALGASDSIE